MVQLLIVLLVFVLNLQMARVKLSDGRIVNCDTARPSELKAQPSRASRTASAGPTSRASRKSAPCKRSRLASSKRPSTSARTASHGQPSIATRHDTDDPRSHDMHKRRSASHRGQRLNQWEEDNMLGALSEWQRKKSSTH